MQAFQRGSQGWHKYQRETELLVPLPLRIQGSPGIEDLRPPMIGPKLQISFDPIVLTQQLFQGPQNHVALPWR